MTTVTDTAGSPERSNNLHRRREAASRNTLPVVVGAHGGAVPEDRTLTRSLGPLLFVHITAQPRRFVTRARHIARATDGRAGYAVVAVVGPSGGSLRQGERILHLRGGDLVMWDADRPHELDFPPGARMEACLVPRSELGPWAETLERMTPLPVGQSSPSGAVLGSLIKALADTAGHCPTHVARQLAGGVTDLVAALIAEAARGEADASAGAPHQLVREIRAYIGRHLMDPGLCPESIAAAHHLSVRSLHKLFEGEDHTVARQIQRCRLEECAKDLLRVDNARLTIACVARKWGYINPAHFSRLFRSVYGVSPSQWRAGHTPRPPQREARGSGAPAPLASLREGALPHHDPAMKRPSREVPAVYGTGVAATSDRSVGRRHERLRAPVC
ncbi:helix-turn-helix domain-containing protein [Streptomyces sp. NPDC057798]|uniref:helix-turn-helix domain-containing protein n=1 Tax=Streptomyces sp. NPDC057798 TaxID=3346252 RepID=UPI0036BFD1C2